MTPDDPTDDELARLLPQAVALRDAPPAWVRRAIALWPAHGPGLAGALRRIVATLAFDSGAQPAGGLLAARGGDAARQLLYSAEGRDVDLRIARPARGWRVSGQVLGPDETGRVELVRADDEADVVAATALSPLGEFVLDGVAAGRYALVLTLGDAQLVVPAVDVGIP